MANPVKHHDGSLRWLNDEGLPNRIFGPAIVYPDGSYAWYRHGKLHRTDGPAVQHSDGTREFHLNTTWTGNDVDIWLKNINATDEEKVMLKLKYGGY